MDELGMANCNNRRLEKELKLAKAALWDQFFLAALSATLHHGKTTGVAAAAEIADEAMRVRSAHALPVDEQQALRDLRGLVGVLAELLEMTVAVIETISPESDDEKDRLNRLAFRSDEAVLHVKSMHVKLIQAGGAA